MNRKINYELVEIGGKVVIATVIRCSSPEPNATNNNEILFVFETIDLKEISIFNVQPFIKHRIHLVYKGTQGLDQALAGSRESRDSRDLSQPKSRDF